MPRSTRAPPRVSRREASPARARVVTRAASEVETVLFITNDKGEFVRAGSTASTVAVAEKPAPAAEPEETAADRAASAQAWIDAAAPSAANASSASPAANVSDAVANAADAQKWIGGWNRAGAKAVNPAAKDPVVREKLGASAVEKGALMKQWSVGKAVDKLLGRNPASRGSRTERRRQPGQDGGGEGGHRPAVHHDGQASWAEPRGEERRYPRADRRGEGGHREAVQGGQVSAHARMAYHFVKKKAVDIIYITSSKKKAVVCIDAATVFFRCLRFFETRNPKVYLVLMV